MFEKFFSVILYNKKLILFIIFSALLLLAFYLQGIGYLSAGKIVSISRDHSFAAPFIYVLFYALMVVVLVPTLPLNLGAGFLWGGIWGGVISIISVSIGASLSFVISRYLAHDFFESKFKGQAWILLNEEIRKKDWKIIAFTRINPLFPFSLVSYFFGLTKISFRRYFWSTVGFISGPAIVVAFVGNSIGGFILNAKAQNLAREVLTVFVGITLIAILKFISNIYFKSLKK